MSYLKLFFRRFWLSNLFLACLSVFSLQAKTFVIPHVLERSGSVKDTAFTIDTVIVATYIGGLRSGAAAGEAKIDVYLYEATGQPMRTRTGAVCGPCSFSLNQLNRTREIRIDDLITSGGGFDTPLKQGFAVIVVGGDDANVKLQGFIVNSLTGPLEVSVFGFQPEEVKAASQARVQQKRSFVLPHVLEKSGRVSETTNTFDSVIYAVYTGGLAGIPGDGGATVELYLYDDVTGQPIRGNGVVCNPCSYKLDAANRGIAIRLEDLMIASDGTRSEQIRTAFGVLVVSGADPDHVSLQGFVVNAHTSPFDLSVFGFEPQPIAAAGTARIDPNAKRTIVAPHVFESKGNVSRDSFSVDTLLHVTYGAGLPGFSEGNGAAVDLYLYDEKGRPLRGTNGDVCNPCSFNLSQSRRKESIRIDDLITKMGGFTSETIRGFAIAVINGDVGNVNLQGFIVNSHTGPFDLSVFGFEPTVLETPNLIATRSSFVLPHILETSGRVAEKKSAIDTTIFATYAGGRGNVPAGDGATLQIYLYDAATSKVLRGVNAGVCNPCAFKLNRDTPVQAISLQEVIDAAGGFLADSQTAFAEIVVEGETDKVNLQSFVVNSHSGPFDLSVFGFEPQPIEAAATTISPPQILSPAIVRDRFQFSLATVKGENLVVEVTDVLGAGSWKTLEQIAGDGSVKTVTDPASLTNRRYYRVRSQ